MSGVREVRIRVTAPTDENAEQWAQTIRDAVVAEYGQEMRLDIQIIAPSLPLLGCVPSDVLDHLVTGLGREGREGR